MFIPDFPDSPAGSPPPSFPPGMLAATPGALNVLTQSDILTALRRHLSGDWGDVPDDDKGANDAALIYGHRLLSAYRSGCGTAFWIITEWDRSATTILLPSEY